MSEHRASIAWKRESDDFSYAGYDRTHTWTFEGGARVKASAAPEFQGDAALVNPEEALAAALSSCHMLTFLAIAARKRYVVDSYEDAAVATLDKNAESRLAITRVILHPRVVFSGEKRPDGPELEALHESAHRNCFIANSVRTELIVEPRQE